MREPPPRHRTTRRHAATPTSHRHEPPRHGRRSRRLIFFATVLVLLIVGPAAAYTIKSGDTLSAIAARDHTTVACLAGANHITNPDLIYAGANLNIAHCGHAHVAPNHAASTTVSRSGDRSQTAVAFKDWARGRVADAAQFSCLDALWTRESGWNRYANNPSSAAYGIPQANPGSKMATAGSDWQWNGYTQMVWGLSYIWAQYGSACGAWGHSQATGWY